MKKLYVGLVMTLVTLFGVAAAVAALTADEILDRMSEEADILAAEGMVSIIRFDNAFGDGTTGSNLFGSLAVPGRSLIYFIEPFDVAGTIFLTHEAEHEDETARLWLYLPMLGIPKELVSEEDRGGSFAGSALSYSDLADREGRTDYDAELLGEDELVVGDEPRTAYRIESTAKPEADVNDPRTVIWVDTEFSILLKMESYNDLGHLSTTLEVVALGEFEDRLIAVEMLATNQSDNSTTTIAVLAQRRPASSVPDEVFSPENLSNFDPSTWGFDDPAL
jgi:hypothetical protein